MSTAPSLEQTRAKGQPGCYNWKSRNKESFLNALREDRIDEHFRKLGILDRNVTKRKDLDMKEEGEVGRMVEEYIGSIDEEQWRQLEVEMKEMVEKFTDEEKIFYIKNNKFRGVKYAEVIRNFAKKIGRNIGEIRLEKSDTHLAVDADSSLELPEEQNVKLYKLLKELEREAENNIWLDYTRHNKQKILEKKEIYLALIKHCLREDGNYTTKESIKNVFDIDVDNEKFSELKEKLITEINSRLGTTFRDTADLIVDGVVKVSQGALKEYSADLSGAEETLRRDGLEGGLLYEIILEECGFKNQAILFHHFLHLVLKDIYSLIEDNKHFRPFLRNFFQNQDFQKRIYRKAITRVREKIKLAVSQEIYIDAEYSPDKSHLLYEFFYPFSKDKVVDEEQEAGRQTQEKMSSAEYLLEQVRSILEEDFGEQGGAMREILEADYGLDILTVERFLLELRKAMNVYLEANKKSEDFLNRFLRSRDLRVIYYKEALNDAIKNIKKIEPNLLIDLKRLKTEMKLQKNSK